jgi:hypothetical protein
MPSITSWTRLEPRTQTTDPLSGLEARIADPLWLLARQWQLGAFRGEDGGSPVNATARVSRARISRFLPRAVAADEHAPGEPYDQRRPLDAVIAAEAPPPDLRLRARAGQRLLEALGRAGFDESATRYLAAGPFDAGDDLFAKALAGRVCDGARVRALVETDVAAETNPQRRALLVDWLAWCRARFGDGSPSWVGDRFEYQLSVEAAGAPALVGRLSSAVDLEWHSFDAQPGATLGATEPATEHTIAAVPAPVQYAGMPSVRFWQFEDARVFFGGVDVEPGDLGRMLLVDFALNGADDWFVVPVPLARGAVHSVVHLEVVDTFGRATTIEPVDTGTSTGPRWSMFRTTQAGATPLPILVVPPSTVASISDPIEDVAFVRDEAANLGWAIERTVEDSLGRAELRSSPEHPPETAPRATPAYRLRTAVPPHWTPLVPIETAPGVIELRRGRVAGEEVPSSPRSLVLADTSVVREDALPREGVQVTRSWAYARWIDGTIHTWRTRETSRRTSVVSSGLAYDVLATK